MPNTDTRLLTINEVADSTRLSVKTIRRATQGGDLAAVAKHGMNNQCGLLVNVSRQIIYASPEKDFAAGAAAEASKIKIEMEELLAQAR